jgi:hypothetical protein
MPRKRHTPEAIIQPLCTGEPETGTGVHVLDACQKLGITQQPYYTAGSGLIRPSA